MSNNGTKDLENIGLSEKMRQKLQQLVDEEYFAEMKAGYRLAASIAIFKKIDIANHKLVGRQNMYDVGGVDENESFKNSISQLFPEYRGIEYRSLEKFADLGVNLIFDEINDNEELNIESLLNIES